jgi:transcriptional regulator GlxA family with amidase domain
VDRRVVVVTFPFAQMLDIAGPLEVFSTAAFLDSAARYPAELVSAAGGLTSTSSGFRLATDVIDLCVGQIDTLVVAGGRGKFDAADDGHLVEEVRRLAACSRRVTSVCTGAFVLAAAGLLDGRRVTSHWRWCPQLAASHPRVRVDADAIYVRDGTIWTSAGITAGIDLALALVADDHGTQLAAAVARELVVYLRRAGGQTQFSAPLAAQVAEREPLRDLLDWILQHPDHDLSVAALARRMHLSDRQLSRVFRSELGITPADHVEVVRVEAARRLLETTRAPVERVARLAGFGTTETMQRTFRRRLGTTPSTYRLHFEGASTHTSTSTPPPRPA